MPENNPDRISSDELKAMFDGADPDPRIKDRQREREIALEAAEPGFVDPALISEVARIANLPEEEKAAMLEDAMKNPPPSLKAFFDSIRIAVEHPEIGYTLPVNLSKHVIGDAGFSPEEWLDLDDDTRRTLIIGLEDS